MKPRSAAIAVLASVLVACSSGPPSAHEQPSGATSEQSRSASTAAGSDGLPTTSDATRAITTSGTQPASTQPASTQSASTQSASSQAPVGPPTYTPAVDAGLVDGACPYLTVDQVKDATGQRIGPVQIRPADPQPVCEFIRSDGGWLATVRILQFPTQEAAVAAVDFYAPIATSDPEAKPAGWSGGSQPATHGNDNGTVYAVSKGAIAVIALCNQPKSIYSRELVIAAIGNLGL